MTNPISRRTFLRYAAISLGGTALAACAAPAGSPAATGSGSTAGVAETSEIAWFEWGDINDKQIADATVADFQEEHSDITVRLEQPPSGGNYYEKLQATIAAGTAPDILNFQTWRFQPFAAKNVLQTLNEHQSRDGYYTPYPEQYESAYTPQTQYRGQLYGVPWNMNSMIMFYAKEPFDRAGIDYPTDDWTFEEFVEKAIALTGEENGTRHFGYQTNISYERLACWMRLNGDVEWDSVVDPRTARWTQDYILDAINFQLYETVNTLNISPTPAMMQGGTTQLQSGNVAMKMEGPWFMPQMMGEKAKREGGTPFDVVQLPKGPKGERAHMVFGHVLTMNNTSKNKDAAWELLKFAGSEGGQKHVAAGGRQPVTPQYMEQYWVPAAKETYGLENMDAFINAFETGIVHLAGEVDDRYLYNEVLQAVFDKMIAGEATAHEVIPDANAAIQQILDEYWAEQDA
jgi:multiple sugar transport system substrate-binding protein